jgi:hypothetical protein
MEMANIGKSKRSGTDGALCWLGPAVIQFPMPLTVGLILEILRLRLNYHGNADTWQGYEEVPVRFPYKLQTQIQGASGRCWMFGTIVRRKLLRELHLEIPLHFV